jgi:hypothetical protein
MRPPKELTADSLLDDDGVSDAVIDPEAETLAVELSVPVALEEPVAVPVEDAVCNKTRTRE